MLDVSYQAMEAMVATMGARQGAANPGSGGQNKAEGKSDFDSMVEQKQQEVKEKQTQKTDNDAGKDKAEPAAKDETVPDEQYAVAAAMMLQVQPEIQYIDPTLDAAEQSVLTPEIDEVLPEVGLPVQDTVQDTAGQVVTQVTEQAADVPVEEAAAPVEIAPQETQDDVHHETGNSAPREGQVRTQREDAPAPENVRWEAPVFGNVSAAPVKVAPPQEEPIELQAPNAAEDLAGRIEDLLAGEGIDKSVEFTLVPESLGKITVQITHGVDGSLHVLLNATTERAAALLDRHTGSLQNLLAANGRTQTQVEVRANEESQRQFFNPNGENNQGRQQQQQQRQPRQQHSGQETQDFVQQLRLGLLGRESDE